MTWATAAASGIAPTDVEFAELNMPSEASAGRCNAPKMMSHEIDVRSWSDKFEAAAPPQVADDQWKQIVTCAGMTDPAESSYN